MRLSEREYALLCKKQSIKLERPKTKRLKKPTTTEQRYFQDQANIMANWLELYGKIPCITEAQYHQMQLDGTYRAHMAVREFHFAAPDRLYRADFCWPAHRVILEIDGGLHLAGGGRHNSDKDRDKLNLAALLNYRVVRFSTDRLKANPLGCVDFMLKFLA